jgi:hypothetical protein
MQKDLRSLTRRGLFFYGLVEGFAVSKLRKSKKAIHIVANQLILANAFSSLFTQPSLKRDGNEFTSYIAFIAVGFSRRIKRYQSRALAESELA